MSKDDSLDLSMDDLDHAETAKTNLGLEEQLHRRGLQQSAFSAGLAFAALLFMVAVFFGGCLLFQLNKQPGMHWHASVLVAAFIVPPIVIYLSILKAVYKKDMGESSEDSLVKLPFQKIGEQVWEHFLDFVGSKINK